MAGFYRRFGRGNRAPAHGRQHAGQAKASQRKRRLQALKSAALTAEASRLGITVPKLQQQHQRQVDAVIAAQQAKRAAYTPPPRPAYQSSYSWY